MTVILAIDAAWTEKEPSGVALVVGNDNQWECLCAAPSYDAFMKCVHEGISVDWYSGKFRGSRPNVEQLLGAAKSKAGKQVDLVALDMPIANGFFSGRRAADNEISRRLVVISALRIHLVQRAQGHWEVN